jgi:hypothetical protein
MIYVDDPRWIATRMSACPYSKNILKIFLKAMQDMNIFKDEEDVQMGIAELSSILRNKPQIDWNVDFKPNWRIGK